MTHRTRWTRLLNPSTHPPAPTPGFTPAPIQFTGDVDRVSGHCPNITIAVGDQTVETNADTDFRGLKCSDVKKHVTLGIEGVTQSDNSVLARVIRRIEN